MRRNAMSALIDERTWVEQVRRGDQTAFEAILTRYERPIYSYIYRMMGNADDALDLTQESFLKAYRAIGRTGQDLNLSAWLHRIASNTCLDVLRRRRWPRWLPWDGPRHDHLRPSGPADDPERVAIGQETRAAVQRTLDRMSPRHRQGLLLREYQGLSCAEIGEVMGLSRSATKSLLYRAREEFRRGYGATNGVVVRSR
jgi:RNA polymerase sigma-70 factor, ECF subfamily